MPNGKGPCRSNCVVGFGGRGGHEDRKNLRKLLAKAAGRVFKGQREDFGEERVAGLGEVNMAKARKPDQAFGELRQALKDCERIKWRKRCNLLLRERVARLAEGTR